MFVLAAFNLDSKFFIGKSSFSCPQLAHKTHELSPSFGIKIASSFRQQKTCRQCVTAATQSVEAGIDGCGISRRRVTVFLGFTAMVVGLSDKALAVKQLQIAGRVPGLSPPDEKGMRNYRRPDAKSGGHGVGWSPIIPYTFTVPPDWDEVPVSIADLGGTEIDLRFANQKEGVLFVVVAPVQRFADTDNVTIEDIGSPEKVIYAFGPEVIGQNVEGKLKSCEVNEHSGKTYYQYELESPHALITATATGNRLYLMTVSASGLQWKKHYSNLKRIADSFRVDDNL